MKKFTAPFLFVAFLLNPAWGMSEKKADFSAAESAWVKRSAGAASCEGEGEPLALARKSLENAKVRILQEQRAGDGMMHIQMCGADTGQLNAFQIPKAELDRAKAAGFSEAVGFSPKAH